MKTKIGYYIEERKRSDGRSRLRFVVPERLRPVGWPKSRPLFLEGQDGIDMAQLAPEEEVELRRQADILYTDLCKARAGVGYANADPVQPAGIQKASLETWRTVIALRRSSEKWHGNSTRTQDNYELLQQRLVIMSEGMGLDLATSPQSEFERALMLEVSSKYSRRELYRELRALASMAIREGLRPAHLVITSTARPPKAKIQLWKEADVYCLVTEMLRNNEEGLAKFILTQWEIGQRIRSVINLRYGYNYRDGCFFYRCRKTDALIRLRVENESARQILDRDYRYGDYMFTRIRDGKPFGRDISARFGYIRSHTKGYENSKLKLSTLRHTAIVEFGRAGCTVPMIASVTGHSLKHIHATLEHYLSQDELTAVQAMGRRQAMRDANTSGTLLIEGARHKLLGHRKPEQPSTPAEVAAYASL